MEGPLELNSNVGVEEPIKSETSIQNPSTERNENAASPPPSCSICLGNLVNTSFTDSCLHQFCFICLLQWSKIKTECPLCKQTFKSIIHNVRSEEDYDQYHVNRGLAQVPQNITLQIPRRHYFHPASWISLINRPAGSRRTTDIGSFSGIENGSLTVQFDSVQEELPILRSQPPQVPREERRRRIDNPEEYRRNVYRHNLWARPVPDIFGRFRECSSTYYRRHPEELNRLMLWLNRELKVLLTAEHRVLYALNVIRGALTQYDILSPEFQNIVHPFVGIHTAHFLHELYNFAKSNFDLVGYDESVMYFPNALSNEYVSHVNSPATSSTNNNTSGSSSSTSSSSTDDDSDVRIVDEAIDLRVNTEVPSTITNPMPGPSTGQSRGEASYFNEPDFLVVSISSSEDECEIIGYVKPRHERTPEIIELVDSETEHLTQPSPPQPSNENTESTVNLPVASSSCTREESVLSSDQTTSTDTFSDSDYSVKGRRKRRRSSSRKSSGRKMSAQTHKRYMTRSRDKKRSRKSQSYSWDDSDSSSDSSPKRKRSRTSRYKVQTKGARRVKRKKEESYSDSDSSSDESTSTESSNDERDGKYRRRRPKTRRRSSSTKTYTAKNERTTRNRALNAEKSESKSKDPKYNKDRQSRSRSSSVSSDDSGRERRPSYCVKTRRLRRETDECGRQDDCASVNKGRARSERASKSTSRKYTSEDEPRTSSRTAHLSAFVPYSRWRRIECKEYPSSSERTCNSSQCNEDFSVKSDAYSDDKDHSLDCYDCYKEKQTASKTYKRSKRDKSENEKRSRPKRKRHILSSSSSN